MTVLDEQRAAAPPVAPPLLPPASSWLRRRRFHQRTFVAAGIYNISWGLLSVAFPGWFFAVAGMPPANHPQIFATLGMVIGLYGILYLEVARDPEHGWLLAAVGLTGKVLGPLGLAQLILSGTWPARSVIICLTNDLIWWIPFATYLVDAWPGSWVARLVRRR
jgi:hypothetical protein